MKKLQGVKLCKNDDIQGYSCGREQGHQGKHIAFDQGGMVVCEWYDKDIAGRVMIEFIATPRQ